MTTFLSRLSGNVNARTWEREPQLCPTCNTPMFQVLIANGIHQCGDYICSECERQAYSNKLAQIKQATLHNLYPQAGQFMRSARQQLMHKFSKLFTPVPAPHQDTAPIVQLANAIQRGSIANIPTDKLSLNPITPLPETRAELSRDVSGMAESLILWNEEDPDPTERRPIVVVEDEKKTTNHLPALEIWQYFIESQCAERGTGEQEPVQEMHRML